MAVRGLTKRGLQKLISERGSIRDGFLIYIHGNKQHEEASLSAKLKLYQFLSDKVIYAPVLELLNDRITVAILIEDDKNLAKRLSKTLILDYGLFNNDIGFIIYEITCYKSKMYEVTR